MTKYSTFVNGLTEDVAPDVAADFVATYDNSASTSKKVRLSNIAGTGGYVTADGWVAAGETWTYAGADDPTYTLTIATDLTGKYSAGMRVRVSQSTGGTKYFIITKVAYGAPNTTLTLYGGTDYNLENEAISNPYYSVVKAPFGFPLDPTKWTVEASDTVTRSQATPTINVWYNLGAFTISIPIGVWNVSYQVLAEEIKVSAIVHYCSVTLSTANDSESDVDFTSGLEGGSFTGAANMMTRQKTIALTSKTSYYLNMEDRAGNAATIYFVGAVSKTIIRAVCAYL